MRRFIVTLVCWLVLAAPVWAGPLEDAFAAYEDADYATALRLWRPLAEQDSAYAQFGLGIIFQKAGRGVPQDYVQAHKWYTLAAAGGNATAETNRQLVAKRMTPAQIADAQRIAREWLAKHGKAE